MPRYFWTIQKKVLAIVLVVGLAPAIIGLVLMNWGSRWSYERAMGAAQKARAAEVAARLGELCETLHRRLNDLTAAYGDDESTLLREVAALNLFDAVIRHDPPAGFAVDALNSRPPALIEELRAREAYFAKLVAGRRIGPEGYFGELNLRRRDEALSGGLVVFGYPVPDGGHVFFVVHADRLLRQIQTSITMESDLVYLYSHDGYLLTSNPDDIGALAIAREQFSRTMSAMPDWISINRGSVLRSQSPGWRLVGYAVVPHLSNLAGGERNYSPWVLMVGYDMETFLGPWEQLLWISVFVAFGWALLLMGVSVAAARRLVGPVKSLRHQVEAMTAGNLEARASVHTRDEIEDLADAFNTMAAKLSESYHNLEMRVIESRLRADHINVINEITKAITRALDLDRIFEIIKVELKKVVEFDGIWIALTGRESSRLEVTHAEPPHLMERFRERERELKEASPHLDEREQARFFRSLGYASWLTAPLPSRGSVIGRLTVASRKPDRYSPGDSEILDSVAGAVAVGIDQAMLFERTRRFAQELEQKVEERTRDLARANKKLIQTEKYAATGRLAGNLAHEINNPLGIIKNYLRLVAEGLIDAGGGRRKTDPNLEHIDIINEEIDRIARIVRQLLDLHRPPEQSVERADIDAIIGDIVALMQRDLEKDKIEIVCKIDPDLPRPLVAPDLIRQVLINLIRNAQDAMEGGGRLTLRAAAREQWESGDYQPVVAISIIDTGAGIPPEYMTHIFDPFFTTKSADKGTGLGLSVSYGIVQMYGGTIEAFSEPGKGTTMVVTLPVDPPSREELEERIPGLRGTRSLNAPDKNNDNPAPRRNPADADGG